MCSSPIGPVEDFSSALFPDGLPVHAENTAPVGGLQMSRAPKFDHQPVMAAEVVDLLAPVPAGLVVDATVGGGGHAAALLGSRSDLRLLGVDRDPDALAASAERLAPFEPRVRLAHARFSTLPALLADRDVTDGGGVSAVLFDLGVSSPQLDRAERGFSLRQDGPLDMRMDPTTGRTAADVVNGADETELARLFAASGEGRWARRIARTIVAARPLTTTAELAGVVSSAVPAAARRRGHPATRVFQALRIEVNDELGELATALDAALDALAVGGRCLVIAYHSGEDRLVKETFGRATTGGCTCPPNLPCVCGARIEHRLVGRGARKAGDAEVTRNPRATSARLRAVERITPPEEGLTR
jgi:16S rRNA (cytosine1402-N4)-methyltransferase